MALGSAVVTTLTVLVGGVFALYGLGNCAAVFIYVLQWLRRRMSEPDLVHMTSVSKIDAIKQSKHLRGRCGVFAVQDRVRCWPRWVKMIVVGIPPRRQNAFIQIPPTKTRYFWRVFPLGPFSFLKWLATTHVAFYRRVPFNRQMRPSSPCPWLTFCCLYACDATCVLTTFTYVIGLFVIRAGTVK